MISGAAKTVGSGTGNMAVYNEEYVALLQQFLEDEGDRALCAQIKGTSSVVQAEWGGSLGQTPSNSVAVACVIRCLIVEPDRIVYWKVVRVYPFQVSPRWTVTLEVLN